MKGRILEYSVQGNSGTISGDDGKQYGFGGADWKGQGIPARGVAVDFESDGSEAKSIFVALGEGSSGSKNKTTAGLLAIFLGWLGIHKFYLGFTGPGLVYILVNTVGLALTWMLLWLPNYALGLIAVIEGVIYLTKSDEDFERDYVEQRKQWF